MALYGCVEGIEVRSVVTAKARAKLEAGVLNDPEALYKFVTTRPDVVLARSATDEATAADIERQREDADFLALVEGSPASIATHLLALGCAIPSG